MYTWMFISGPPGRTERRPLSLRWGWEPAPWTLQNPELLASLPHGPNLDYAPLPKFSPPAPAVGMQHLAAACLRPQRPEGQL